MCGVILSAGASTRMGRDKALLPWPTAAPGSNISTSETLLSATILALRPFTEAIVVVAGRNADNIAPVVAANGASMVRNPDPDRGQFSSLQVGLHEVLARCCDAAMITLVDCPPLNAASMENLSTSFYRALALGKWGVAPENNGKRGHPLLASRSLIEVFLRASVTSNAREIKRAHAHLIESVPVPDSFVSVDVNTPEEYAALWAAGLKPH
ncbi:MAG TPA: nucleotidyltransferase family protein [Terracidiphilus sp.]|nr:nucleotidyltransferase family protein [Terracidiphilus sp.]